MVSLKTALLKKILFPMQVYNWAGRGKVQLAHEFTMTEIFHSSLSNLGDASECNCNLNH